MSLALFLQVCSEVESHSGGAVNAVVQREVTELERKLLETLAQWNPQTFLNKTAMLGHHDFLQQQKVGHLSIVGLECRLTQGW